MFYFYSIHFSLIMSDADDNSTTDDLLCPTTNSSSQLLFECSSCQNDTNLSISELSIFLMTGKLFMLGMIILIVIFGNVLVLFAVFVNSHLRSTTHYFIVNLAVADLLLGTTVLPFSAILESRKRWDFGLVFCDIWAAVDVLCCTASIISLCVISVDRYIGVTRPLAYSSIMTKKRAILLILLVWIVSAAIGVGPLLGWKEPNANPEHCSVTKQTGYVLFSVSGSFYIPTVIILVVYYRIYREAIEQTKFLERGVKTTKCETNSCQAVTLRVHTGGGAGSRCHSTDNLSCNGTSPERNKPQFGGLQSKLAKFKRQKKAAKTLGIVVGVFILCWFPFFFILPLDT